MDFSLTIFGTSGQGLQRCKSRCVPFHPHSSSVFSFVTYIVVLFLIVPLSFFVFFFFFFFFLFFLFFSFFYILFSSFTRPNFVQGTGLQPNSTEFYELYGNWSQTVTESLQVVRDAGGYTWSNVNCELDPPYGKRCDVNKAGNCSEANQAYVGPNGVYPCGYVTCTCVKAFSIYF